jgi:tetratricopeptide (TPR) repeat protein
MPSGPTSLRLFCKAVVLGLIGLSLAAISVPGPESLLAEGKRQYAARNYAPAVQALEQAVKQSGEVGEAGQMLALSYYSLGRFRDAIPLLEKQSTAGAAGVDNSYLLGMCYLRLDDPRNARRAFARMHSVPEESAAAHLIFARMLVREHLEEKAVPELEACIKEDPRLPMAHFLLGEIFLYKRSAEEAVEQFRQELAINPAVWLVPWRLGDALARLNKFDEAERALKQSIWLNESFSGPYVTLGQIALKKGDPQIAIGYLEKAAKLDPNNYHAHFYLAKAYKSTGRDADADRQFALARTLIGERDKAVQLEP